GRTPASILRPPWTAAVPVRPGDRLLERVVRDRRDRGSWTPGTHPGPDCRKPHRTVVRRPAARGLHAPGLACGAGPRRLAGPGRGGRGDRLPGHVRADRVA